MSSDSYSAIEDRISEAYDAIHDGWYSNCTQVAKVYEVPLRRLQRRRKGASNSIRAATKKVLTEAQEGAIHQYIDFLDKMNIYA